VAPAIGAAAVFAARRLALISEPRYQYDATLTATTGEDAYSALLPGDWVTVTAPDEAPTYERIVGIAMSEDDNGNAVVQTTMHDVVMWASPVLNFVALLRKGFRKMAPGTSGGDWKEAQPVTPPVLAPLVPQLIPARDCLTESFNKADGAGAGPDLTWAYANNVATVSGEVVYTGITTATAITDVSALGADVTVQVTVTQITPSGSEIGLAARQTNYPPNAYDYWGASIYNWDGSWVAILQTDNGTTAEEAITFAAGDTFALQVSGDTASVLVNGVSVLTATGVSLGGGPANAGYAGFYLNADGVTAIDDFSVCSA
jgi:hypothetical protein